MDAWTWFAIYLARAMSDLAFNLCEILGMVLIEYPFLIPPLLFLIYLFYRGARCFLKHRKEWRHAR